MTIQAYVDTSGFQGWKQYFDTYGQEWRIESIGGNRHKFYRGEKHHFVYEGCLISRFKDIKILHEKYERMLDE
jgi:hypothetical protein